VRFEVAVLKAELGAEVLVGVHEVDVGAEHTAGAVYADVALQAGDLRAARGGLGLGADQLHVGHPVFGELELAVEAAHPVEAFEQLSSDKGTAKTVLLAEILV